MRIPGVNARTSIESYLDLKASPFRSSFNFEGERVQAPWGCACERVNLTVSPRSKSTQFGVELPRKRYDNRGSVTGLIKNRLGR
ncbi:hypothetical protein Agabi119p4_3322 [Agaricus bisporus var. burnettii]|uniref:Uncharacterized protein n=1 Tax=Agaricus bisporus var. burnettii TaxID=192524 RepID=A0A8H7F6V6_AGABI|nr:hypothetical protein Agabi119p4_3322 [Agaricus bisporus var. burnettii]